MHSAMAAPELSMTLTIVYTRLSAGTRSAEYTDLELYHFDDAATLRSYW